MEKRCVATSSGIWNPQTCSMTDSPFELPAGVPIETHFYYRSGGKPWHRHVHLVNGRAQRAQVYPEKLVCRHLRGLQRQLARGVSFNG